MGPCFVDRLLVNICSNKADPRSQRKELRRDCTKGAHCMESNLNTATVVQDTVTARETVAPFLHSDPVPLLMLSETISWRTAIQRAAAVTICYKHDACTHTSTHPHNTHKYFEQHVHVELHVSTNAKQVVLSRLCTCSLLLRDYYNLSLPPSLSLCMPQKSSE